MPHIDWDLDNRGPGNGKKKFSTLFLKTVPTAARIATDIYHTLQYLLVSTHSGANSLVLS